MPILFALVGATGIGKTELSLSLAERHDAEIISVDSRQIYQGFSIGTAQPAASELAQVKHHLVNFLEPTKTYSAGAFCKDVKKLLAENPEQNYILVGGTGLYLQALTLGLPEMPAIDGSIRKALEKQYAEEGYERLRQEAMLVDPEATTPIPENNVHRIMRVLEVWKATGKKFSELQKQRVGGIGTIKAYHLQRSREILYKRINERVDQMMKNGWLDECVHLSKIVPMDAPAWQSLGYRELLDSQNNGENILSVIDTVKQKTRNYAKRQLTWFRWQMESEPVNLDDPTDIAAHFPELN
mgnify:CR=1 FL=1